jgi:hypothetical protein
MTFNGRASGKGISEFWIPDFFGTPTISGTNISIKEIKTVEGGFRAFVEVEGEYQVNVTY